MQKKYIPLAISVLVLFTIACLCTGAGLATPTSVPPEEEPQEEQPQSTEPDVQPSGIITEVVMAKDTEGIELEPVDPTTVFGPEDTIHAVARIEDAPSGTAFTVAFYVVDVGGAAEPNTLINSSDLTAEGTRNLDFYLSPTTTWPPGTYRVEISVNGTLDQVVEYTVE